MRAQERLAGRGMTFGKQTYGTAFTVLACGPCGCARDGAWKMILCNSEQVLKMRQANYGSFSSLPCLCAHSSLHRTNYLQQTRPHRRAWVASARVATSAPRLDRVASLKAACRPSWARHHHRRRRRRRRRHPAPQVASSSLSPFPGRLRWCGLAPAPRQV